MRQKTWADLLGNDASNCIVDGKYISRQNGNQFRVLWSFDNQDQASEVMQTWLSEIQTPA